MSRVDEDRTDRIASLRLPRAVAPVWSRALALVPTPARDAPVTPT